MHRYGRPHPRRRPFGRRGRNRPHRLPPAPASRAQHGASPRPSPEWRPRRHSRKSSCRLLPRRVPLGGNPKSLSFAPPRNQLRHCRLSRPHPPHRVPRAALRVFRRRAAPRRSRLRASCCPPTEPSSQRCYRALPPYRRQLREHHPGAQDRKPAAASISAR
jgi:hypothetical protein